MADAGVLRFDEPLLTPLLDVVVGGVVSELLGCFSCISVADKFCKFMLFLLSKILLLGLEIIDEDELDR